MTAGQEPETLSVEEVAAILGLHKRTVYKYIADGSWPAEVPVIRHGHSIRIPAALFREYHRLPHPEERS